MKTPPEPATAAPPPTPTALPPGALPLLGSAVRLSCRAAMGIGIALALLGGLVLTGWFLDLGLLQQLHRSLRPMAATTAVSFFLAGIALYLSACDPGVTSRPSASSLSERWPLGGARSRLARLCTILIMLLSAASLLWHLVGISLGIDLLLLSNSHQHALNLVPGRMAVATSIYFLLIGAALLQIETEGISDATRHGPRSAEWLACAAVWLGGLALSGWVLRVRPLSVLDSAIEVAPHTGLAMVVLGLGLLFARPQRGLTAVAMSDTAGGTLMRRLVPFTLLVPPLGMWVLVELAPRLGLFDVRFGTALCAMAGGAVVAVLEVVVATRLAIIDSERLAQQASLHQALSELNAAISERDRIRSDLVRSNRDLDEFAYAASHDLRAPLRGIANLAQWLEEDHAGELSPGSRQKLELLRGRVHRMEALIDGILKYSRAGRSGEPAAVVDVGDLLREVVEMLSPPPGARIEVATGLPRITTSRSQLERVFLNLISNALKHARREDPWVRISAEDSGDFVRFVIADNGPGIAPQYQDRIWGMFQTLVSRDEVEGTGIGLATVKKLVERHGGRVGVESAEGQGARFFFLWPREPLADLSSG